MFFLFRKKIRLVCFDMDNTLYDFNTPEAEAEVYMSKVILKDIHSLMKQPQKSGRSRTKKSKPNSSSLISEITLLRVYNDVKKLHVHHEVEPQKFSRELWYKEALERLDSETSLGISINSLMQKCSEYEKKYWDYLSTRLTVSKEALNTLEDLRAKGLKIASITDSDGKPEIKIGRIKSLGLDKYFDYIITTDDTGKNKPAVENWQYLLKISGLKPQECLMVGDHPEVDLAAAKRCGLITSWTKQYVNTDLHWDYVNYEIHSISEIVDIVKKYNKI